jgi:transposase
LPNSALQSVQLYSILATYGLPVGGNSNCIRSRFRKKEISYSAIYLHFSHWSHDGSLKKVWQESILTIQPDLNLSELNLDGTHSLAKKGGESVAYQRRKKGKTSNILPMMDANGYIVASTGIMAGNHNDAYCLESHLQTAFKEMKRLGLTIHGAYFNADMGFDTRSARKTCFNHGLIPNIPENLRNRKQTKRGRKRLFNAEVYKNRFCAERTFAWVDKFKRLLIRFERYDVCFLGAHYLAFTMINLRHVLAKKSKCAPTS